MASHVNVMFLIKLLATGLSGKVHGFEYINRHRQKVYGLALVYRYLNSMGKLAIRVLLDYKGQFKIVQRPPIY